MKKAIKAIAETMVTIAMTSDDVVYNKMNDDVSVFKSTLCEELADALIDLGVHEPHAECFFEIEPNEVEFKNWVQLVLENPGPDA